MNYPGWYIYIYILISKIWGKQMSKVFGWIQRNPNRSGYQGCLGPPCIREEPEYIKGNTHNTCIYRNFNEKLGGGLKYFLFSPLPGEDSHFD